MSSDEKGKQVLRQDQPVPPSLHFELNANDAICQFLEIGGLSQGGALKRLLKIGIRFLFLKIRFKR